VTLEHGGRANLQGNWAVSFRSAIFVCGLMTYVSSACDAQMYPAKPIRLIVPFAPGGGADIVARLVGTRLSESLKQQVVIDNRAGAAGNIGAELAARAAPDGYTLALASANWAMNVSLYGKQAFDPIQDFAPVTLLATTPNLLVVHPSLPVSSVKELITLARSSPGKINYSSGGSGSTPHLAAELFKAMANVDIVHVPYKGTGPAVLAVISGESSLTMVPALSVLPHIKTGKLNALAITSARRAAALPQLPTVAESGVPGYEASQWYGIVVPARTPVQVIDRLNAECVKIIQASDLTARLVSEASIPAGTTPQQFASYFKEEIAKWAKAVKLSGARVE
jgi:tripartite-type tricarboxylate transporter receptor subunit TctC